MTFPKIHASFTAYTLRLGAVSLFATTALAMPLRAQAPAAKPTTVQAGAVMLTLPAPSAEFVEGGPPLREMLKDTAPAASRILTVYALPADIAALRKGTRTGLNRYAEVQVFRKSEAAGLDAATFQSAVDASAKQFQSGASLAATSRQMQDVINQRLAAETGGKPNFTFDKPTPLGPMFRHPEAAGFAIILPEQLDGKSITLVGGTIMLRVRSRFLFAYLYTEYKGQPSVDWVTHTSEAWAAAILKANP